MYEREATPWDAHQLVTVVLLENQSVVVKTKVQAVDPAVMTQTLIPLTGLAASQQKSLTTSLFTGFCKPSSNTRTLPQRLHVTQIRLK